MQLKGRLARATGSSGPKTSCRGVSCWVEYQALVPHCAQSSAEPPQRRVASAQTLWPTETALQWEALRDCSPERQAPPFSCCMFFLIHLINTALGYVPGTHLHTFTLVNPHIRLLTRQYREPHFQGRRLSPERLSNLPKALQPVGGEPWVQSRQPHPITYIVLGK